MAKQQSKSELGISMTDNAELGDAIDGVKPISPAATAKAPELPTVGAEEPAVYNPAKQDLPSLIGNLIQMCLYDRKASAQAKRDLTVWYNAQDLDKRKETAKEIRKTLEIAKLVSESLYSTAVEISMNDV